MKQRTRWLNFYSVIVGGKPVGVEIVGYSKADAKLMLADQWELAFPAKPLPKRYRLEKVDSWREG